jgi:hypothetical protein
MTGLDQAAKEIFQILGSYNYTVQLFGEDGGAVEEPEEARRMFSKEPNVMVSIIEDTENSSVNLKIGNDVDINSIEGLIQTLRTCCTKFTLNFHVKRYEGEITPKDINETRGYPMNIFEGLYGTSRSSYLKLENARMIIKHSSKIDETKHGARARCIESIFVENSKGERMLFPTNNLLAGRAMAQHVSMGGGFADQVAGQITRMAGDFQNLATASQHVFNNGVALPEGAGAVREACKQKMAKMRKTFEKMSRPNGYTVEAAKMIEMANALIEGDEEEAIDHDKLEEVRSMIALEGVEFSDELVESVFRAVSEEEVSTDDSVSANPKAARYKEPNMGTISVLGKLVNAQAWADLSAKKIDLVHNVSKFRGDHTGNDAADARFSGYTGTGVVKRDTVLSKLQEIVPSIKDDSLMNLMSYVAQGLAGEGAFHEVSPEDLEKMKKLAAYVVRVAGMANDIPTKVGPVAEYINWFNKLSTRYILSEDNIPSRHLWSGNPADDEEDHEKRTDGVRQHVLDDFDVTDFVENYIEENGLSDESIDPSERKVENSDLLNSIEIKLLSDFETVDDEINPPSEMMYEAKELLKKVKVEFEEKGFVVNEDVEEGDSDPWNDGDDADNIDLRGTLQSLGADDRDNDFGDWEIDEEDTDPWSGRDKADSVDHRKFRFADEEPDLEVGDDDPLGDLHGMREFIESKKKSSQVKKI